MVYWPSIFSGIELCSHPEHVQNDGSQQLYVTMYIYMCITERYRSQQNATKSNPIEKCYKMAMLRLGISGVRGKR